MEQLVHTLYQFLPVYINSNIYIYVCVFFYPYPQTLLLCASSVGRLELVGGGSLQISNLTEEDGGIYTCTASNANATIEAQTQLTIQGMFNKILSQCQNIKKKKRTIGYSNIRSVDIRLHSKWNVS